jgi:hypothetical protein
MIWAYLLHLGYNMWEEEGARIPELDQEPERKRDVWKYRNAKPYLRCNHKLFRELTQQMAESGLNAVVIDIGEGLKYESHPEIAVRNSWTPDKLRKELAQMRKLGLEPIPKLNFSTTHDEWLGPYSRCVSTDTYYRVCSDLIKETVDIFDKPRFFHLGMDEETANHQRRYLYTVVRQQHLWWHDFYFLVDQLERNNVRPWIWASYLKHHPKEFFKKMPKSVLQSNWYYGFPLSSTNPYVKEYLDLEEQGYDQVPCGSNYDTDKNFGSMVCYLKEKIAPERLKGFLQAPWFPTLTECEARLKSAVNIASRVKSENGF